MPAYFRSSLELLNQKIESARDPFVRHHLVSVARELVGLAACSQRRCRTAEQLLPPSIMDEVHGVLSELQRRFPSCSFNVVLLGSGPNFVPSRSAIMVFALFVEYFLTSLLADADMPQHVIVRMRQSKDLIILELCTVIPLSAWNFVPLEVLPTKLASLLKALDGQFKCNASNVTVHIPVVALLN
jgi:hypothetical protein